MQPRQKGKLLILENILLTETDENHKLSGSDLIARLAAYDISCERKTVYDDIATLCDLGVDIVTERVGHSNYYYVCSRQFQDEELLVLADAVASSRFLTKKKSNELIKKLQGLTSRYKAARLRRSIYVGGRVKTFNEAIYYSINSIHEAIYRDLQINFKYTEYDLNKKKRYRHNGELYTVSPYYLIWENDCYYLVCYCSKHSDVCRYRVDRMSDVALTQEKRRVLTIDEEELAKELLSTYNMYGGAKETITLEMSAHLINVLIDRFGDGVRITRTGEDKFTVRLDVQISPTFWGWLFQFGTDAKVTAPLWVCNEARQRLESIASLYQYSESDLP